MPFNLGKIIVISSASTSPVTNTQINEENTEVAVEQQESQEKYLWEENVIQTNDVYIYLDKNNNYKEEETIRNVRIENIQILKNVNFQYAVKLWNYLQNNIDDNTVREHDFKNYYDNDELIRRHHILNPYTGHSEDYYRSVTLFSESRPDILDALSTALFNINDFELIKEIIDEAELTYNINIDYMFQKEISDKTLNLYLNEGYEKTITKKYTDTIKINEIVRVE